jgi:Eukaryotic translation initiation factor 3 subunit 7 (eIF-3)
MRPMDFAGQLNVSLANGWGIVRTVADLCLKMPEGKYVLVKDPNKVSVYSFFAACVWCWRISKARAKLGACPDGTPSMDPSLSTLSPAHGLFYCSRLSDCMPSLSRHSPGKRKRKKARRPRKKWSPDPLAWLLYCIRSLIMLYGDYDKCIHVQIHSKNGKIVHEIPDE